MSIKNRQHYEITKKLVNGTSSDPNRDELEYKAECLHRKMKSKAKQINKLKNLRQVTFEEFRIFIILNLTFIFKFYLKE
jgi:hypothetical protein